MGVFKWKYCLFENNLIDCLTRQRRKIIQKCMPLGRKSERERRREMEVTTHSTRREKSQYIVLCRKILLFLWQKKLEARIKKLRSLQDVDENVKDVKINENRKKPLPKINHNFQFQSQCLLCASTSSHTSRAKNILQLE